MKELKIRPKEAGTSRASVAHLDGILQAFGAVIGDGGVPGHPVYIPDINGCYEVRSYNDNMFFVEAAIIDYGFEIVPAASGAAEPGDGAER